MNKPRLKAIQLLDRWRAGEVQLGKDAIFELTLLETGSRELAEAAHMAYCKAMLRAGRTPD